MGKLKILASQKEKIYFKSIWLKDKVFSAFLPTKLRRVGGQKGLPTCNVPQSHCSWPSIIPLPHIRLGLRRVLLSIGQSRRHPRFLLIDKDLNWSKLQVLKSFIPLEYLEHNNVHVVNIAATCSSSHNVVFWQRFRVLHPSQKTLSILLNAEIGFAKMFSQTFLFLPRKVKTNDTT